MSTEKEQSKIDFEAVNKKLENLAESMPVGRPKTATAMLDNVRESLIKARKKGATFKALTTFLNSNNIAVSETSLRQYLNKVMGRKRRRRSPLSRPETAQNPASSGTENPPAPAWKKPLSEAEKAGRKLPPRLLRRDPKP